MGRKKAPVQMQNATNMSAPWSEQQGHLKHIFGSAYGNYQNPQTFFPGQTYAPFDPAELEALNLTEQRARNGSPSTKAARDYAMGILSGNPESLKATLGPRVGELLPGLQSQFNRAGMGASSLARSAEQELVMRELSKLRESAADRLERLGPREYEDFGRLAAAGETRRDMAQQGINEARARHEFAQMEPHERLARYLQMVSGNYGGTSSQSGNNVGFGGSRLSGLLGGGLAGAQLGGMFGPAGAGIGGILGGLGGLF